ncbi:MAG: hypothetical protein ACLQUY_13165 [Ktedonobacterales bacterium]
MNVKQPKYTQGCAVLYDSVPYPNAARLVQALNPQGTLSCQARFAGGHAEGSLVVRGRIDLGQHSIDLISVAAAADDQASRLALLESLLSPEDRQTLQGHQAYIHCLYAGGSTEPLEQLRALYRVVAALTDSCAPAEALGLLDVPALQAFARADLLDLLKWLDADPPPIGLWVRVVEVGGEQGGLWLVTRGLFHFFQPEIAVDGQHLGNEESAESLLMSLASWLIQGSTRLHLGDTLDMLAEEGRESRVSRWRCRPPSYEQRWLAAPYGTVILEPA